jgi:hypothetical protein
MKNVERATIILAMLVAPLLTASAQAQTNAAVPADVASPEAIVLALYETVQREPGENYDWPRMRTLFLPTAAMIPAVEQTGGEFRVLTVQDFVDWIDAGTVVGGANDRGFQEEQIAQRVERFGDIAQVFSTYQKHFWGDSNILGRGINSIQLVNKDGRWWIVSVIWDEERGAGPLPARYLTN